MEISVESRHQGSRERTHRLILRKVRAALTESMEGANVRKILVGISGGVDSCVLLHLLGSLREKGGFDLAAAHVHHGVRGAEADRDAEIAEKVATRHSVEFHVVRIRPPKGKNSAEHELRELRLSALERVARRTGAERIALAHHRDDQAETLLLRLLAGSDLRGLSAIRRFRPPYWIRPLLGISRAEIEKEAKGCGISYGVDSTNLSTRPRRNFLRRNVLPLLARNFNPRISQHLADLAESITKTNDWLEGQAAAALAQSRLGAGRYDVTVLRLLPDALRGPAIQRAYRDVAGEGAALSRAQIKAVDFLLKTDGDERSFSLPRGISVRRAKKWIRIGRND
jgi:tRNA(Ile)-lysidine synthase